MGYSRKNPHTPCPTDGILEILVGGGLKDHGNPGRRGGSKKSAAGIISADTSRDTGEVMGSNPVEVLTFSGFCLQLLKLRSKL